MCIWSLLTHPFSVSTKQQQQMEFPDDPGKQSWRVADNEGSPCWISQTLRVCIYVSVCTADQGSKRMIQLCTKDRMKISEVPFQPSAVIFTAIHGWTTILLHWTLHELATLIQALPESRLFQVLFFAEASNWKDCNCKMSLRLNDCNFNSLTSLQWEYLEQYITISAGSWST